MKAWTKGDRVVQPTYGPGTLVEVNEHHTVIDFDEHGRRTSRRIWSCCRPPTNRLLSGPPGNVSSRSPRPKNPRPGQTHSPRRISGSAAPSGQHAVDVELAGSDHEVDVRRAAVAAGALELLVAHRLAAVERELVGGAERDVARRVLVEERVVEEHARTARPASCAARAPSRRAAPRPRRCRRAAQHRSRRARRRRSTTRPSSKRRLKSSISVPP